MKLTTVQLAERTGVPAGTLRVWQARHGFPQPAGTVGRRPTYSESDAIAVERLLRLRAEGLSMSAAVARARIGSVVTPASIYAALRAQRPELKPRKLRKRALLALTHAIEDEYAAHAGDGLLLGSFQERHHYRASERRWRELSRTCSLALAMADFRRSRERPGSPVEVRVARDHPLSREWTLVVSSRSAQACLAAWEVPLSHTAHDGDRQFELVWSFDPPVVAAAASAAAELLGDLAPRMASRLRRWEEGAPGADALGFGADLTARALAYLAA